MRKTSRVTSAVKGRGPIGRAAPRGTATGKAWGLPGDCRTTRPQHPGLPARSTSLTAINKRHSQPHQGDAHPRDELWSPLDSAVLVATLSGKEHLRREPPKGRPCRSSDSIPAFPCPAMVLSALGLSSNSRQERGSGEYEPLSPPSSAGRPQQSCDTHQLGPRCSQKSASSVMPSKCMDGGGSSRRNKAIAKPATLPSDPQPLQMNACDWETPSVQRPRWTQRLLP